MPRQNFNSRNALTFRILFWLSALHVWLDELTNRMIDWLSQLTGCIPEWILHSRIEFSLHEMTFLDSWIDILHSGLHVCIPNSKTEFWHWYNSILLVVRVRNAMGVILIWLNVFAVVFWIKKLQLDYFRLGFACWRSSERKNWNFLQNFLLVICFLSGSSPLSSLPFYALIWHLSALFTSPFPRCLPYHSMW